MDKQIRNSTAEFLIFTSQNKEDSIEVKVFEESVWLTQNMIAQLFEKSVSTINEHIKNIYKEKELSEIDTIKKFGNSEFAKKPTNYYNLDLIISIGYRVNSKKATQFRQWATSVLKEFAIKGFVLDKKRLENGSFLGQNYFDRLLEEIREIRVSERMFYQKLTDIYSTSVDYNKDDETMGGYNPDWAVIFETYDKKNIYFVAETKKDCKELNKRVSENLKIEYAKKYFELLNKDENITYDCVNSYEDLVHKILK